MKDDPNLELDESFAETVLRFAVGVKMVRRPTRWHFIVRETPEKWYELPRYCDLLGRDSVIQALKNVGYTPKL